jgi:predicted transcriptional regulator
MVQAYNFLASWQLFPEKSQFEYQLVPKSGNYKIESIQNGHALSFSHNWVNLENEAFYAQYHVIPNGELQSFENIELADTVSAIINNASCLTVHFIKEEVEVLQVVHEILANGFLKVTHKGKKNTGDDFTNIEVYHKQLSVLPYASSAGSVAIRPTKEGVIKHKALSAMEDQTNMQLNQIKEQIELLARQAQEIRKRKELILF